MPPMAGPAAPELSVVPGEPGVTPRWAGPSASRRRTATNSSPPTTMVETPGVVRSGASAARLASGSVEAWMTPWLPKTTSVRVSALMRVARRRSRLTPARERPQDLGAEVDRHRHDLQQAFGPRPERDGLVAGLRLPGPLEIDHRGGRHAEVLGQAERPAIAVGHEKEVGVDLRAIVRRQRLHRRLVIDVDGGLQLGQVGDQARLAHEVLEQQRLELLDERAGLFEAALEILLGAGRRRPVDDEHRHADRQHGQQGAGQEDAVAQRGEQRIAH